MRRQHGYRKNQKYKIMDKIAEVADVRHSIHSKKNNQKEMIFWKASRHQAKRDFLDHELQMLLSKAVI